MDNDSLRWGATPRNLFLVVLVLVAAMPFVPLPREWGAPIWGTLLLAAFPLGLWWRFQPERVARHHAPDVLADLVGGYFEREGLCFAPRLSVEDGLCWFSVYCQNRYSRACRATVCFVPMEGMAKEGDGPHDVQPIMADVECDGGEVAVVSFPYPIAGGWQEKIMIYDVVARTDYPGGVNGSARGKAPRSASRRPKWPKRWRRPACWHSASFDSHGARAASCNCPPASRSASRLARRNGRKCCGNWTSPPAGSPWSNARRRP